MSIAVIEDDAGDSLLIQEILKQEGFLVESFADPETALRAIQRDRPPSLIILDLDLAALDASSFRARLLCDPRLALVPVIILSAGPEGDTEARRLGAADFLAKPFSPEELLHVVQNRAVTLTRTEHFLRGLLRQSDR